MADDPTLTLFDAIVPLGQRCGLNKHLRRYYGTATSYPFDWWVTSPDAATRFLRDWDVDTLYDPALLGLALRAGWVIHPRHKRYGMIFAHEFPKDRRKSLLWGWRKSNAGPKSRTGYLMAKLDALNAPGTRVLFVRHLPLEEASLAHRCVDLRQAVLDRFGQCQARFLLISPNGVTAPGWTSLATHDVSKDWAGDAELWDAAFETLGFRYKRPLDATGEAAWRRAQKRLKLRRLAAEA